MFKIKKVVIILLSMILVCSILGCGDKKPEFGPITINLDGTKVILGESKLQTIINFGYKLENTEESLMEKEMPDRTYATAGCRSKDDKLVAMVGFLNNETHSVPIGECIIHEYEIQYRDVKGNEIENMDNVSVNDVKLKGMKVEDIKKAFKETADSFKEFKQPDGSVSGMLFAINHVVIDVHFDYTTKEISSFSAGISKSYFE